MPRSLATALLILASARCAAAAAPSTVVYSFTGGTDGMGPTGGLVADRTGTLYGTTCRPGQLNNGTVFSLARSKGHHGGLTYSLLYQFPGNALAGYAPCGTLYRRGDGALFGTTESGGGAGAGTVFQLSPPGAGASAWTETVLHSFGYGGKDGEAPEGNLVPDATGRLFGTTVQGGKGCAAQMGCGVVFMMTPPAKKSAVWTESIVHAFAGRTGKSGLPGPNLAMSAAGVLYGTTPDSVFSLTPSGTGWTYQALTVSPGLPQQVEAGVAIGPDGTLYGVSSLGGRNHTGVVFALHPPAAEGEPWSREILHEFGPYKGNMDGTFPSGLLRLSAAGSLFGTVGSGGQYDAGVVFRLDPPAVAGHAWKFRLLTAFDPPGSLGPQDPVGPLLLLKNTAFLTTSLGGTTNDGTVVAIKQ